MATTHETLQISTIVPSSTSPVEHSGHSPFVARDRRETLIDRLSLLLACAGAQDDDVIDAGRKLLFEFAPGRRRTGARE